VEELASETTGASIVDLMQASQMSQLQTRQACDVLPISNFALHLSQEKEDRGTSNGLSM
jgi:hypothetical protein